MANNQSSIPPYSLSYLEEYNGQGPFTVGVIFIVLEVIAVVLHFWSRIIGKIAWGADDTLIIIGAMQCLATIGCCLGSILQGGIGYHWAAYVLRSSPSKLVMSAKWTLINPLMCMPAVVIPKLAILVLYLRIFTNRVERIACWVIGALLVANCVGFIRRIQLSRAVKFGLFLTILTGSSGMIAAIIRLEDFFAQDIKVDATWKASRLYSLSIVENGMYLIAACLPTYRPLASLVWRKMLSNFHFGSGADKTGQRDGRVGVYEPASKPILLKGFARVDEAGNMVGFSDRREEKERADMP
ncbi:hypothetical protein MMC07_009985 [Pseudocyphellaria aurata]|nr:hypothetical protein [Pseudocyphellaria aurata]